MTQVPWNQMRSVVETVMDLPLSERQPYLDRACPDPELRKYVDSLLASFERADTNFLTVPAAALVGPEWTGDHTWTGRTNRPLSNPGTDRGRRNGSRLSRGARRSTI
jgi:hypothetical protein